MNAIVARYDRDAADYERYWAPVLEQSTYRLLDYVADHAAATIRRTGTLRVLEVGVGTGALLLAALRRWPEATFIATDAAAGMVALARRRVAGAGAGRVTFHVAAADALPVGEAAVDLVLSTFVLQLVPDRLAALREARRVLVPRGRVAYLSWLDRELRQPFRPADEFDEAVWDLHIEEPEFDEEPHAGDVRSARTATNELRRAGLVNASAREDVLDYRWSLDSYLDYKLRYDETALLSVLDEAQRIELERRARERLSRLSARDFHWHAPIVFARAERPA